MLMTLRGCAQHGEVVRHERHLAPVDAREARDLAVGGRLVPHLGADAAREAPGLAKLPGSTR